MSECEPNPAELDYPVDPKTQHQHPDFDFFRVTMLESDQTPGSLILSSCGVRCPFSPWGALSLRIDYQTRRVAGQATPHTPDNQDNSDHQTSSAALTTSTSLSYNSQFPFSRVPWTSLVPEPDTPEDASVPIP